MNVRDEDPPPYEAVHFCRRPVEFTDAEMAYVLAAAAYVNDDFRNAVKMIEQAIAMDPEYVDAIQLGMKCYCYSPALEEAQFPELSPIECSMRVLDLCKRYFELCPELPEDRSDLGRLCIIEEAGEKGKREPQSAQREEGEGTEKKFPLNDTKEDEKRSVEKPSPLVPFSEFSGQTPDQNKNGSTLVSQAGANVLCYRGVAQGRMGMHKESVRSLERALEGSESKVTQCNLQVSRASVCEEQREYDEALDLLKRGEELCAYDYVFFRKGRLLEKLGREWLAYEQYGIFLELAAGDNPYRKLEFAHAGEFREAMGG